MVRVYAESVKKWGIRAGIPAASIIFLYVLYTISIGAMVVTDYRWSEQCAGTPDDPCWVEYDFYVNEDVFWYPVDYDPWGRDTPFTFSSDLRSWQLQRSWGEGWRNLPLDKPCTGTWCGGKTGVGAKYSVAWRTGKNYTIRILGYKNDFTEDIDVSFNPTVSWTGVNMDYELIDFKTGITKAEMIFKIKLDKDYKISDKESFTSKFESPKNFELKGWDYYTYENESYQVNEPIYKRDCHKEITKNGTTMEICNRYIEKWNNYTAYRDKWNKYDPLGKTLQKNEYQIFKLVVKKDATLGPSIVDVVPEIGGFKFPWSWWNTSYGYCINVTGDSSNALAREYELITVMMNSTVWDNAPYDDSLRVVDELCGVGGSEMPSQVTNVTLDGTAYSYMDVHFLANRSTSTAFGYSIYWSTSDEGASTEGSDITIQTGTGNNLISVDGDNIYANISDGGVIEIFKIDADADDWLTGDSGAGGFLNLGSTEQGDIFHYSTISDADCETRETGKVFTEVWCNRSDDGMWYNKLTVPKTGYYIIHNIENSNWNGDSVELNDFWVTIDGKSTNTYLDYYGAGSSISGGGWVDYTADRSWYGGYTTDHDRYYAELLDDREDTDFRKIRAYSPGSTLLISGGRTVSQTHIESNTTTRIVFPPCTGGTCNHSDMQTVINESFTEFLFPLSISLAAEQTSVVADTTPPNVDFIAPTDANGTESYGKDYITWNISVNEDVGAAKIMINGTNQTATCVNDTTDSYCYYNETSLTNSTRCGVGHATDASNNWNTTLNTICRDIQVAVDVTPPVLTFTSPTLANTSTTENTWLFINVSADETLNSCDLDWELASNETMTVVGDYCYLNKTGLSAGSYYFRVYGDDADSNLGVTEDRELSVLVFNVSVEYPTGTADFDLNFTSGNLTFSYVHQTVTWWNATPNNQTYYDDGFSYQETPDSTSCSGDWDTTHDCADTHDGDWDTYGHAEIEADVDHTGYVNMTYYIGSDFYNVSLMRKNGLYGTDNLTIPSNCLYGTELLVQMQSIYLRDGSRGYRVLCWDGDSFDNYWGNEGGVDGCLGNCHYLYEEGIYWNYTSVGIYNVTPYETGGTTQTIDIEVSLNQSVESCMTLYLTNSSSVYDAKDTDTAITLSDTPQTIYSNTDTGTSRYFWEWVDMDNCTVPLTFAHVINFTAVS